MQLGMIEDSYLPGPLQCFCGTDSRIQGQAVAVTLLAHQGSRGKRRPWHCLMYFTHTGKDGFFSGSESLDLCSPLTPDSDTSLTCGVLLGEAAFVNDTVLCTCLLSCACGMTELLSLEYRCPLPVLYGPLMLELPET